MLESDRLCGYPYSFEMYVIDSIITYATMKIRCEIDDECQYVKRMDVEQLTFFEKLKGLDMRTKLDRAFERMLDEAEIDVRRMLE